MLSLCIWTKCYSLLMFQLLQHKFLWPLSISLWMLFSHLLVGTLLHAHSALLTRLSHRCTTLIHGDSQQSTQVTASCHFLCSHSFSIFFSLMWPTTILSMLFCYYWSHRCQEHSGSRSQPSTLHFILVNPPILCQQSDSLTKWSQDHIPTHYLY